MDKLRYFKIFVGFIFLFFFIGVIFAVGSHYANSIISGTFIGDYSFEGSVDISSANLDGLNYNLNIPSGTIIAYPSKTIPSGWLECNGSEISRINYASLFSSVGTTYGSGDGSTTFNLPDLRGEFVRGFDDGKGVDSGRVLGSFQSHQIQDHSHSLSQSGFYKYYTDNYKRGGQDGTQVFDIATVTVGNPNSGNHGAETRPRNIALVYIIKI